MKKFLVIGTVLASIGWIVWASFWAQTDERNVVTVTRNIGGRKGFRTHWDLWCAAFARDNPGWEMELVDLGDVNGPEYYKRCIATGDLPDVLMTWQLVDELSRGGYLIPVPDGYYERYGVPVPEKVNGRWYATQGGVQLQGIAVNKRMWADIGITEPCADWAAFVAGLRKLKARGYRPLVFGGREWSAGIPFNYWMEMDMYAPSPTDDGSSWTLARRQGNVTFAADPTARRITRNLIALLDEFAEPGAASVGYDDEQRMFYSGEVATWIMGCWISGGLEAAEVDFEIDYWPLPSMTGRPAKFINSSTMQSGWAISTSATGAKLLKAQAALHAFYDRDVYQAFLNGEGMFACADKVDVAGPKSTWPATQTFYGNMDTRYRVYGDTVGFHSAADMPDPAWQDAPMRMTQEILAGTRGLDELLGILDDAWDSAHRE